MPAKISKQNKQPWFEYPVSHWKNKHAVVIGGGIAGCQMAWHLCERGWQVTLIERHVTLATEASGNPIGVISPKMTSQASLGEGFYSQCFGYTLSLLNNLKKQGKETSWNASGMLQLYHNAHEKKRWDALKKRQFSSDFIQLLNPKETTIAAGIDLDYCASYFPNAGWIEPTKLCQALCDHPNCKIIVETEALFLKKHNKNENAKKNEKENENSENWLVQNQQKQTITKAEAVIICSGKDLFSFEQSSFLPHLPVAGQTTFAQASEKSRKLKTVIGHEGYLTPAINQQHIFGATFERNQNEPTIHPQADEKNQQQLEKYLPDFYAGLVKFKSAHTAVRVTTPDRFPYVGAVPDKGFYQKNYADLHQGKHYKTYPKAKYQPGLFVLGGLGSRGLTTSGLCAKILCNLIENKASHDQKTFDLLHYCHPARFLIKALKRNKSE